MVSVGKRLRSLTLPMQPSRRLAHAPFRRVQSAVSALRRRQRYRRARGFTLLEVMIAFLISGLALGVLFQSGLSSLQSIQTAARYEEALARARSRLATAVHGAPMAPGELEGDDGDGYHWRVRIAQESSTAVRPYGMRGAGRPTWIAVGLYSISVWVSWADHAAKGGPRREVRLDTQHVEALPK
jgi:general secretion pathway protein I